MPPQQGTGQSQSGILQSLQNGVSAIRDLITGNSELVTATENVAAAITIAFPPIAGASSTTAPPAGTIVFTSSLADAFAIVTTSSGKPYRIALYPSS